MSIEDDMKGYIMSTHIPLFDSGLMNPPIDSELTLNAARYLCRAPEFTVFMSGSVVLRPAMCVIFGVEFPSILVDHSQCLNNPTHNLPPRYDSPFCFTSDLRDLRFLLSRHRLTIDSEKMKPVHGMQGGGLLEKLDRYVSGSLAHQTIKETWEQFLSRAPKTCNMDSYKSHKLPFGCYFEKFAGQFNPYSGQFPQHHRPLQIAHVNEQFNMFLMGYGHMVGTPQFDELQKNFLL